MEESDGTQAITYQYNPDGIRISKDVDGIETVYVVDSSRDYAQVIAELDETDTLLKAYLYGTDLIAQEIEGDWRFYHYDSLGTTRELSDSAGVISDSYNYEAFGGLLASEGSTDNNYLYTGEQFDAELDNYYLRARYYNQDVGRFTQMDEWLGEDASPITLNKYLDGNADPINFIDPSGHFSLVEFETVNVIRKILTKAQLKVGSSVLDIAINKGDAVSRSYSLEDFLRLSEAHLACQIAELLNKKENNSEFLNTVCQAANKLDSIKFITFGLE